MPRRCLGLFAAALAGALPAAAPAQVTNYVYAGDSQGDALGRSVASCGDVNGDGYADVIAGAPGDEFPLGSVASPAGYDEEAGSVRIIDGKTGAVLFFIRGISPFDEFGHAVAGGGDVDGDGVPDFAVGAPNGGGYSTGVNQNGYAGERAGTVTVYSGANAAAKFRLAPTDLDVSGRFGHAVALGDANGDGFADLLASAPLDDKSGYQSGTAKLYSIASGALLREHTGQFDDQLGTSLAFLGNVDGAAGAEYAIGVPFHDPAGPENGAAFVYSGTTGALVHACYGTQSNNGVTYARSLASAGDTNGDGIADLLVGSPTQNTFYMHPGRADLYSGATGALLKTFDGASPLDAFGWSVAGAGDANGDGRADILIGAPGDDDFGSSSGSAWLYSGLDFALIRTHFGDGQDDEFGAAVAGAGDVDGDGRGDGLVGAPLDNAPFSDCGSVRVFSGAAGSNGGTPAPAAAPAPVALANLAAATTGSGDEAAMGSAVALAGDLNGDGHADLIAGAPQGDLGLESGFVRAISGADQSVLAEWQQASPGDEFGAAVAAAGDVDGDGYCDVAVGAPNGGEYAGTPGGAAAVYSGATGAVVRNWFGLSTTSGRFGAAIDGAGDADGDGIADVVVGAPHDGTVAFRAGRAFVLSGAGGEPLHVLDGAFDDWLGLAVAGLGDVNGDGRDDFAVAAPYEYASGHAGFVRVHSGSSGAVLAALGGSADDSWVFGRSVAGGGDVDGDGSPDLAVGAPYEGDFYPQAGSVQVFSGSSFQLLHLLNGESLKERFGWSVARAGDVDDDGRGDVVVGAPHNLAAGSFAGKATVFSGRTGLPLLAAVGDSANDQAGTSVAGGGDFDRDGSADFAVGIPLDDNASLTSGAARVYLGIDGASPPAPLPPQGEAPPVVTAHSVLLGIHKGKADGAGMGTAVALGDVDADGTADVIVGAPFDANALGVATGSVTVYSGRTGAFLRKVFGPHEGSGFGTSVCALGNLDGKAGAEYAVGAPYAQVAGTARGLVAIFSGLGATAAKILAPAVTNQARFGYSVANAGLVDADAKAELIVGAPHESTFSYHAGRIFLFKGGDLSAPPLTQDLGEFEANFGHSVAGAGDFNGDGAGDLVVGVPFAGDSGSALVLSGTTLATLADLTAGVAYNQWHFGASVAGAGDVDGDGLADVLVGAPDGGKTFDPQAGTVWLYAGSPLAGAPPRVLRTFFGDALQQRFGAAVAAAGTVGPDQHRLVAIGSPADDPNGTSSGSVIVYDAVTGVPVLRADGAAAEANFGAAIAADKDVSGDEVRDLAIGSPGEDATAIDAGAVRIFSGVAPTPSGTFVPGDTLTGVIDTFTDQDVVAFHGLKGMKLEVAAASFTGALKPRIVLVDPNGVESKPIAFPHTSSPKPKKVKLKVTGLYQLIVKGDGLGTGDFLIATKRLLPKSAKSHTWKAKGAAPQHNLTTLPGATLALEIQPQKGYDLGPPEVTLTSLATSAAFDLGPLTTPTPSGGVLIGTLELTEVQDLQLALSGANSAKATAKVLVTLEQPAAGKSLLAID